MQELRKCQNNADPVNEKPESPGQWIVGLWQQRQPQQLKHKDVVTRLLQFTYDVIALAAATLMPADVHGRVRLLQRDAALMLL